MVNRRELLKLLGGATVSSVLARVFGLGALVSFSLAAKCDQATNLIRSLRAALAASKPLVDSLVAAGVIAQSIATAVIADFGSGADAVGRFSTALAGISSNDPDKLGKQLAAAQQLERDWRAIVLHGNFASHPRIQSAANIADGIFSALVIYFGGTPLGAQRGAQAMSHKQVEKHLDQQVHALKLALQP